MSAKIPDCCLPLSNPRGLGEFIRRQRLLSHVILAAAAAAFAALSFAFQKDYSRAVKLPVGIAALCLTGVWLVSETRLGRLVAKVKELRFEVAERPDARSERVSLEEIDK